MKVVYSDEIGDALAEPTSGRLIKLRCHCNYHRRHCWPFRINSI